MNQFTFNHSDRGAYTAQISNIQIDGIKPWDAPDFADAFIMEARVDGRQATEEELDQMNDDAMFRYESVEASLY